MNVRILAAGGALALAGLWSCTQSPQNTEGPPVPPGSTPSPTETFIVAVDRVGAPDRIGAQDTLRLALDGVIGPDLCYVFDSFRAERTPGRLDLTVLGRRDPADVCAQAISELRGKEYTVPPPFAEAFLVVVHLPDGKTLERSIPVGD